jgi:hypothetical protein
LDPESKEAWRNVAVLAGSGNEKSKKVQKVPATPVPGTD